MAKKRMFNLGVLDTDAFMDMPLSAQALYFHLNLRADDDGFVGNPKRITQSVGASIDDLKLLIAKRFVLAFEDGVIVIKHWRMHNVIRQDRYTETNFIDDLMLLDIKGNGAYTFKELAGYDGETATIPQPNRNQTAPQIKDKDKDKDKDSNNIARFTPPTVEEVAAYCRERGNGIDAQQFCDYYTANGWKVGKNPMKDWKACVRTWERNGVNRQPAKPAQTQTSGENYDDTMRDIWLREYKKRNEGKE